jgi:hypothetical protein
MFPLGRGSNDAISGADYVLNSAVLCVDGVPSIHALKHEIYFVDR